MKIAVTYENGEVFQHFGHTEQFKIYEIKEGKIESAQIVNTDGNGHRALAGLLSSLNVDTLICGGIGAGAQSALTNSGIRFYGGVSGNADNAVNNLLSGNLDFDQNVHCNHHEHEDGHSCEEHSHDENRHCGGKNSCTGNHT